MLETVLFFSLVSIVTEILLMMQLPKWLRRSKFFGLMALAITLAITGLNLYLGFGTVTGTLTAKLAFVGGFIAAPIVMWWDKLEVTSFQSLRTKLWLAVR